MMQDSKRVRTLASPLKDEERSKGRTRQASLYIIFNLDRERQRFEIRKGYLRLHVRVRQGRDEATRERAR